MYVWSGKTACEAMGMANVNVESLVPAIYDLMDQIVGIGKAETG